MPGVLPSRRGYAYILQKMKSQMAPAVTFQTRTASQRPPDKQGVETRRQTHQEETSQEDKEANNVERLIGQAKTLGKQEGPDIADPKMMLLCLLTVFHVDSQPVGAESKCLLSRGGIKGAPVIGHSITLYCCANHCFYSLGPAV